MPTKGFKEDLVRRLDEAICSETEGAQQEVNNGVTDSLHMVANEVDEKIPMVDETTTMESESKIIVSKTANDPVYQGEIRSPKMDNDLGQVAVYDGVAPWAEDNDQGEKIADTLPEGDEIPLTNAPAEFGNAVCVNLSSERELGGQGPQNTEMEKEDRNSGPLQDSDVFIWPSHEDVKMNLSDPNNQNLMLSKRWFHHHPSM
ncbi:hypothetical protein Nepgr_026055 [Nepenthes gracilis]|uniref:SAP domain-containing protein n=1 Tax=Nepenthes gracilis TaxID=150966 RepID=A0AAD3T8Z6_NEPGR|nr:hypothetical protein Nepgr_026055 [Nepenthes gracilis]